MRVELAAALSEPDSERMTPGGSRRWATEGSLSCATRLPEVADPRAPCTALSSPDADTASECDILLCCRCPLVLPRLCGRVEPSIACPIGIPQRCLLLPSISHGWILVHRRIQHRRTALTRTLALAKRCAPKGAAPNASANRRAHQRSTFISWRTQGISRW